MRRATIFSALLALGTVAAYWPVGRADFVNFDDGQYVTNNSHVFHGLTREGLAWAFRSFDAANWHPLTWVSHMVDCSLFKDYAPGHHWVNVGFHAANAILLFLLLWKMTGCMGRSAFVAGLFAWHPLHVESVAWIAERKDVLSTFFGLLSLSTYLGYVRALMLREECPTHRRMWLFYGLALVFFALGLMSKPMLVTLPFLMLLLDYWPLKRLDPGAGSTRRAVLLAKAMEKLPFFLMSVVSSVVTFVAQQKSGAVVKSEFMPFTVRILNACEGYIWYLGKAFWPTRLGVYYSFRKEMLLEPALLACGALLVITVAVLSVARRAPYVFTGWFWFLGMLVPVIGLVQVGNQRVADRYSYIPLAGIFILVTWAAADLLAKWRYRSAILGATGFCALGMCIIATNLQARYWKDSASLFERALEVAPEQNFLAHHNLGHALSFEGNQREAIHHFQEALRIQPRYEVAQFNWGNALGFQEKIEEAILHYREAIRIKPGYEQAYYNLGKALVLQGNFAEAQTNFLLAIHYKPDYGEALVRLGNLLELEGNRDEALRYLHAGVNADRANPENHYFLAAALARQRRYTEAITEFRETLRLEPNYSAALNDLAWILATSQDPRNIPEAIQLSSKACEATRRSNPSYLDTLGVALSEQGRFNEAIEETRRGIEIARARKDEPIASALEAHLAEYRNGRPYHEFSSQKETPQSTVRD